jgi:hypothetical protein
MNSVYLSQLSLGSRGLLPGGISLCADLASKAGFQGIEIPVFWLGRKHRIEKSRALAREYGLGLHFHEAWSLGDNKTHTVNYVLNAAGMLPSDDCPLVTQFEGVDEPIVAYADRINQVNVLKNIWYQTCSVFRGKGAGLRFRIDYDEFESIVLRYNLPLVLDVQHYLEQKLT